MGGTQAKRRYFIAERREAYLEGLRRTGNHSAAAREAGITAGGARRYRRRMPDYEALCVEAERESQRRLAGAESPFDVMEPPSRRPGDDAAPSPQDRPFDGAVGFESIRRGADGRLKIQAQGHRRWSKRAEDRFFDVLRECGNIAAAARAAGVSREAVWKRRRDWPAFARRFEETMEEAEIVLEYRVACLGTNWSETAAQTNEMQAAEAETPCVPFDPDLAIRFLKWRAEEKSGRRRPIAALPPADEVRERIVRKVMAIKRHKEREEKRREEEEREEGC